MKVTLKMVHASRKARKLVLSRRTTGEVLEARADEVPCAGSSLRPHRQLGTTRGTSGCTGL